MADAPEQITHDELAAMLAEDERLAISFRDTTLAEEQAVAIDYYEAKPFGDEEDGLSQVVTPEVAEVVDYMTVSVARTMVSGDRIVEFESDEEDDTQSEQAEVDYAEEATAAVEYCFMKKQPGYRIMLDWIQAGMIEKIGVCKTSAETTKVVKKHRVTASEDQLAVIHQEIEANPAMKLAAATQNEDGSWLVEIHETVTETAFVDYPIPSEEFLFASRTRNEDDATYIAHRSLKSASDLIEMGFDRALIDDLPDDNGQGQFDTRSVSRWDDETLSPTPGGKHYWLREEYKKIDLDGDGIAELVQVFRVDNVVLSCEEVDENPFVVWCPFPRAHRMVGNSLADKVMDLQRIKSVILRQQLNGLYLTNNPRMAVDEGGVTEDTIDDLLTVRPGGIVRFKGGLPPKPLYEAFDMSKGMTMLEYITGERESRTGITRLNQGLDADALNKTATGTALMQAQGQQMEEFVARNFAEALARLFAKKLRLMVTVGKPFPIKVDGQSKMVDPTKWPDGLSATVRVGLGSGRKDQRLQYRDMMLDAQKEALQIGLATKDNIFKNLSAMVRDAGLGVPTDYFLDPNSPEAQQAAANAPAPPPDPALIKAQTDQQVQGQRLQLDQQKAQADIASAQQQSQAKLDAQREESALKLQLDRDRASAEAQLAEQRMQMENDRAERQFMFEQALASERHQHDMQTSREAHEAKISSMRSGGELDK